jgi:hypothetical protein
VNELSDATSAFDRIEEVTESIRDFGADVGWENVQRRGDTVGAVPSRRWKSCERARF